ncbi:unnamed protein product [Didymodactylos carnosus]|uniref:BAG domain-containing protein n=1 Tax=Didymodactylos carnosus TaxID=1234261 RepID=A0A813RFG5_9BILA|nr:unnamed protein product [Didymodactylos carnosus]CAF0781338.1 unnamed protein product [Didymodactylos carnosus]CAF3498596.1 unnamed protein product [Didymodactylos carnosus]CAF3564647.1 unnamed protein product [Didymodactylos carnosus]
MMSTSVTDDKSYTTIIPIHRVSTTANDPSDQQQYFLNNNQSPNYQQQTMYTGRSSSPSMAQTNIRPGCVSIPVEIVRGSESSTSRPSSSTRLGSPYRTTLQNDNFVSNSPPSFHTATTTNINNNNNNNGSRGIHARQSPITGYDSLINNSTFQHPLNEIPRQSYRSSLHPQYPRNSQYTGSQSNTNEPTIQASRSSEDLLNHRQSSPDPMASMRTGGRGNGFGSMYPPSFDSHYRYPSSDFLQRKYDSPLRRSYDALNDYSDMNFGNFPSAWPDSSFTNTHPMYTQQPPPQPSYVNHAYINPNIVYTNEHGLPTDTYYPQSSQKNEYINPQHQPNFQGQTNGTPNATYDRSRSPASNRGTSPGAQQREHQPQNATDEQKPIPMPYNHPVAPEQTESKLPPGPIPMPYNHQQQQQQQQQPVPDQQVPSADPVTQAPPPPPQRDPNQIALEKLENIKSSLVLLDKRVDEFNGTTRDERSYKELDEHALKLMLQCDELVEVRDEIKEKRKEMIRNVQHVLTKLESKIPTNNNNKQTMDTTSVVSDTKQETLGENNNLIDESTKTSLTSTTDSTVEQKQADATTTVTEEQPQTSS